MSLFPEADARLIAAAPELAKSLRAMIALAEYLNISSSPRHGAEYDEVDAARAALAKAGLS